VARILKPAVPPPDTDPVERALVLGAGRADRAVARLAGRHHGLVTRRHLALAGLDAAAVRRRTASGGLHPRNAAVLAVGHDALTEQAAWLAAVWAYSEVRAAVGYASAAGAWRLVRPPNGPVDVIAPVGSRRPGTRLHRVPLLPGDVHRLHGVPVTSPGRTLADLATVARSDRLEVAVHEAQVRGLLVPAELERARRRSLRRRGGAALRALLDEIDPGLRLRSQFERRFAAFVAGSPLPRPASNALVSVPGLRVEVDVAWFNLGLLVELDGHRFHGTAIARRRDARRDALLSSAGLRVERVTPGELDDPVKLLDRLASAARGLDPGTGR